MQVNDMNKSKESDSALSDFYKEVAKSEADKFDNRLFWFSGGVVALSLGYFQATDTLHCDFVLIMGYALLLLSILSLLLGLIISSSTSNELAIWYGERTAPKSEYSIEIIQKNIDKCDARERKIAWINIIALILTAIGSVLIIIYMFLTK